MPSIIKAAAQADPRANMEVASKMTCLPIAMLRRGWGLSSMCRVFLTDWDELSVRDEESLLATFASFTSFEQSVGAVSIFKQLLLVGCQSL